MKKLKKRVLSKVQSKNPILSNIPNALTILRVILTFVIVYMIFSGRDINLIIGIFVFAALTDWFDGRFARWFKWESEFGRQADMIADRFLWVGTALAFLIAFTRGGNLDSFHAIMLLLIMSREVISGPFALIAFFQGKKIPQARYVAKVNTFIQGFALPSLILSVFYPVFFYLAVPLSLACGVLGIISGFRYISDIKG